MSNAETTLLYVLSTLAQTCAALAAFLGAVGIFRLQVLRERHAALEREVRGWALEATRHDYWLMPMEEVLTRIKQSEKDGNTSPYLQKFKDARARWESFPDQIARNRDALLVFESWNLLVIVASLVGFNYVRPWAGAPWLSWALWFVAVLTALFTVGLVWVWTRGAENVSEVRVRAASDPREFEA